ncbi:Ig-like domain-containing protein, partial [Phaeobacter gallaeciensis]
TATDAHGATAVNDVTVTVTGTNDAPVAAALTVSGDEDTTIAGAVTAIDPDQGETLSYALESGPSNGTVAVNSDGTFSYVGDSNFNGADSFVFRVDDGLGGADTEVVTVNVASVNDAPTASGGSGSVTEDGTLTTSGSITASDADGDSLGYSVVGGGAGNYGSLTVDASGNWEYILANAANNVQALNSGDAVLDSFQILVDDGNGGTAFADVDITVNGADEQSSDLEGQAILWRYLFPTAGSTYYQNSFDVSNGVETRLYNGGPASVDFREDDIFIDFDSFGSSWSTASFNGFEFTFQDADAPALVGFVLDTNMSGLDASDIAFDDDSLSVNWQGLSFSSSTYVEIDFIFG